MSCRDKIPLGVHKDHQEVSGVLVGVCGGAVVKVDDGLDTGCLETETGVGGRTTPDGLVGEAVWNPAGCPSPNNAAAHCCSSRAVSLDEGAPEIFKPPGTPHSLCIVWSFLEHENPKVLKKKIQRIATHQRNSENRQTDFFASLLLPENHSAYCFWPLLDERGTVSGHMEQHFDYDKKIPLKWKTNSQKAKSIS
jgi:hypothetical protein